MADEPESEGGNVVQFPGFNQQPRTPADILDSKGQLRKPYRPSEKVKATWGREGQRREDPGYRARWMAFWKRTVVAVTDVMVEIKAADMNFVEEYVRRCRLSELHEYEAIREPYQTYESGYIAAHPGFSQSRAEAKFARILASDLGLTPSVRRAADINVPRANQPGYLDDQVDADGQL